jgi:hypothetical protein
MAWYQRDRTIQSMRSISARDDGHVAGLHTLTEKADNAAAVEDDRLFLQAVATFLKRWAEKRS